ncbi:MAG TPA: hypothetical protein VH054_23105 [Polyangiaceae bacterium]|nr:hypothetical protein [Polyangiaceae bacterium]
MRTRNFLARPLFWALASSLAFAVVACVDLFHSTSDVQSICEADATDPRCTDAAAPVDICAPDGGVAQERAAHACSWLAACGHPIGRNKTGVCMVDAILAYDCAANPNRKAKGAAKDFWNCMQNANSCTDVGLCVFPGAGGVACTNGTFLGCSQQTSVDPDTRIDCTQKGPGGGENCAAFGQTCSSLDPDASNNGAICVGPMRRACLGSGGCVDGGLSLCNDAGVDIGYACANVGAGACNPSGATSACAPESTTTCSPTNDIACISGNQFAQGCVTLNQEKVDCTAISGAGTCVPIEGGAPGTVPADACRVADGGCADDSCDGGTLVACVRGRSVAIDCASQGLKGGCVPITTAEGAVPACNP